LPTGGSLELALPADWKASNEVAGPAVTVRLTTPASETFVVLLTILPVEPGSPASSPSGVKQVVSELADKALAGATQDHIVLSEIDNPDGIGFSYHVTDRNPERGPRDYREANQGALLIGSTMISFTVLTHTGDQKTVDSAMRLLSTLRIVPAA